jgi:polyhydroxyalkanoate synthesis regulator phasin
MIPDTAQVLAAALKLPREERTAVVDELMRSLDDAEDRMDHDERERLHAAIARSEEQFRTRQGIPAEVVLDRLTKR